MTTGARSHAVRGGYRCRLFILAFLSGPRMSKEVAHHAHESPLVMSLPLIVLALLTLVAGCGAGAVATLCLHHAMNVPPPVLWSAACLCLGLLHYLVIYAEQRLGRFGSACFFVPNGMSFLVVLNRFFPASADQRFVLWETYTGLLPVVVVPEVILLMCWL